MLGFLALNRRGPSHTLGHLLLLGLLLRDQLLLLGQLLLLPLLLQAGDSKQVNCRRRRKGESKGRLRPRGVLSHRPLGPIYEELT